MPALQIHNDPIAAVQPINERRIDGHWSRFVYWLGRLLNMLSTRYAEAARGGAEKVSEVFHSALIETVMWGHVHPNKIAAEKALYDMAYNLTLMNPSELKALKARVHLLKKDGENKALLATFKRAELLGRLPAITRALRDLTVTLEEQMRAQPPAAPVVEEVVAPVEPPAQQAAPAPVRFILADGPIQQTPLNPKAAKIAKKQMLTPTARHEFKLDKITAISPDYLRLDDFDYHLRAYKPDFTAVTALGEHLDRFSPTEAAALIGGLNLMAKLYLYEVTKVHADLLLAETARSYADMLPTDYQTAEEMRQVFRAYITIHQDNPLVESRYKALLGQIPEKLPAAQPQIIA
jgi:hypothetical protein